MIRLGRASDFVSGMHFDPLTLMIVPALLLVAAGGARGVAASQRRLIRGRRHPNAPNRRDASGRVRRQAHRHRQSSSLRALRGGAPRGCARRMATKRRFWCWTSTASRHQCRSRPRRRRPAPHRFRANDPRLSAPTSLVCRLGADTFAAILPAAGSARAPAIADEIRMLFAHLTIEGPLGTCKPPSASALRRSGPQPISRHCCNSRTSASTAQKPVVATGSKPRVDPTKASAAAAWSARGAA